MGEDTLRCFIALPIPDDVRAHCARVITTLQNEAPPTRWVKPENIHLTLKFLGSVPRETVTEIQGSLGTLAQNSRTFVLSTATLGTFGNARKPRVVWLGLGGNVEALDALTNDVEDACAALGFARETRNNHPHLTLGRVRRGATVTSDVWRKGSVDTEVLGWQVRSIDLYQSVLKREGARYVRLVSRSFPE